MTPAQRDILRDYPPGPVRSALLTDVSIPGREFEDAMTELLDDLNETLGTKYSRSRLYEWLRRRRAIPVPVHRLCIEYALPNVIRRYGGDADSMTDRQITSAISELI